MSLKEMHRMLKAHRGSMNRVAERAGVTRQFVHQVLVGDDAPAPRVIEACQTLIAKLLEEKYGHRN